MDTKIKRNNLVIMLLVVGTSFVFTGFYFKTFSCEGVRNGTFHFYPKGSNKHYIVIRKDSLQKELIANTSDTSYWRIHWLSECTLTAKYISGGPVNDKNEIAFLNNHITLFKILEVTKDYYRVKLSLDSLSSAQTAEDTVWRKEKYR